MSERNCRDRQAPEQLPGYWAQDGWTEDGRRNLVFVRTPWHPMGCGHTERATDARCNGCSWQTGIHGQA